MAFSTHWRSRNHWEEDLNVCDFLLSKGEMVEVK
jgi:hypothetical protein